MNERGVILISVLALLLTLSVLWTSLAVRSHQITDLTATLINKAQAQAYLASTDPIIRHGLSNAIYPPAVLKSEVKKPFSITIQLIDAQSKPNINNAVDAEQKLLLTHAITHCKLTKQLPYLLAFISESIERATLYQSAALEGRLWDTSIPQGKSACLAAAFYALPEDTPININTATAGTLALLAPTADPALINGFIRQRQDPFHTRDAVNANYYLGNTLKKYDNLSLLSHYFYSIITLKNGKKSISYKTLWYRELNPQYTYIKKLWTMEV